jgi:hypothetical protein
MALSNAEKQARWRKRNLIALTADACEIARRLATSMDEVKLAQVVGLLNGRLNPKDGRCKWVKDDGGRSRSGIARGHKDSVGDCVVRAIAIATKKPYREVHDALIAATVRYVATSKEEWAKYVRRKGGISWFHADHGVHTEVSGPYLEDLSWKYTSTKHLPRGKGVHLRADELPSGRLIVDLPGHFVAVIDGVIHDTHDCSDEGCRRIHGYWTARATERHAASALALGVLNGKGTQETPAEAPYKRMGQPPHEIVAAKGGKAGAA